MKIASWNVNGIRACMDKGFRNYVTDEQPDIICLQETKATPEQVDTAWAEQLGYHLAWNCAEKKGYSGTAIWSKTPPKTCKLGIGRTEHDREGRVITLGFDDFQLATVYTPNAQNALKRLDYRQNWDRDFLDFAKKSNRRKPFIFCGDLNVAHREIDLANPNANRRNAGFTDEERAGFDAILDAGFVDSFRQLEPSPNCYSWWTYRTNARERNIGWRLDYFLVPGKIWDAVTAASIRTDIYGSDHCPVELEIEL